MKQGSIAKRYATALIKVAQEQGQVERFMEDLERLHRQFEGHSHLQSILDSPVVRPSQKKQILKALLPKFSLSPALVNLMNILIDNDRVFTLPMIYLLYRDMSDELLGRVRIEVRAAVPLGAQEEKLKAVLEKRLKKKVLMEVKVEPEILGGLIVRVQDQVLDASLKRDLERIKEDIARRAVA